MVNVLAYIKKKRTEFQERKQEEQDQRYFNDLRKAANLERENKLLKEEVNAAKKVETLERQKKEYVKFKRQHSVVGKTLNAIKTGLKEVKKAKKQFSKSHKSPFSMSQTKSPFAMGSSKPKKNPWR